MLVLAGVDLGYIDTAILIRVPVMIAYARPDDLLELPDDGKGYEWVDGQFVERPRSAQTQYITGKVLSRLFDHTTTRCSAWVLANFAYRCFASDPDLIRRPSVSLILEGRLSDEESSDPNPCRVVPDLVAEVIGRCDLASDTERRLHEWIEVGVNTVWLVYPTIESVRTFSPRGISTQLGKGDILTASDLIPGYACPVADFFRIPNRSSATVDADLKRPTLVFRADLERS